MREEQLKDQLKEKEQIMGVMIAERDEIIQEVQGLGFRFRVQNGMRSYKRFEI
jgi:hypothetical protein